MYLRHTTIHKDGKAHTYWRLVRAVRTGRKVRQETMAMLGELDAQGRAKARALALAITGTPDRQPDLFEEPAAETPVAVQISKVRVERGRRFGDVWLGLTLWRALKLDQWADQHLAQGREEVPWATMAAVSVVARLCEPSSELHIAEDWFRRTAMGDLLGVADDQVNEDRLYRTLDELLPHKDSLTQHLKVRLGEMFSIQYDLLLYDMTSTYFEGQALGNPLAKRGYSRDHRPDCKQVCIALVVTREGLPVAYEVFAGNTGDSTTVETIVTSVEEKYGRAERIWVMDRGMVSEDNLVFVRSRQGKYVVGTPKPLLRGFQQQLLAQDWTEVQPGVQVKTCPGPDGTEVFLLCRSESRREKERAIHDHFEKRIREGLQKADAHLERSRCSLDKGKVERKIGRLLGSNTRAAGGFDVRIEAAPERPAQLRVVWSEKPEWREWARASEGAYLLRSNLIGVAAETLWKMYIQLTDAESAFRTQKSDLRVRPIWHQLEGRVKAHILVCFLAYVLYKTLEQWSSRAGLGKSPNTLLQEFARIQSADVILPTADGRELKLRCVVQPDRAQKTLLQQLGLCLPRRLNFPTSNWKM